MHHLPVSYHLTAPVSANCNGSRRFVLDLYVGWLNGNPIKLDNGGFDVIQSVHGATTTAVPNVLGLNEAQAASGVSAKDLKPVTVGRVLNPAPIGTIFAQNSPDGTLEPTGSEVDLTVSLGQTTVPVVLGSGESSAVHAISAAGHIKDVRADPELVVHISEAAPGEGMLDFDAFFEVVSHQGENTAVIVEHLPTERALAAIAYVKRAAEERGFTFGG